jgi:hypothetical protein
MNSRLPTTVIGLGLLATSLFVSACSSSSTSSTVSPAHPITPSSTAPAQPPANSAAANSAPASSAAARSSVAACLQWQSIDVKDIPAAGAAPIQEAAAHEAGPQPSGLAAAMLELSQLPLTSLTPDQLATATRDIATIKSDCGSLGVTISS